MSTFSDGSTWGENNIKCPHCGYQETDSWEREDDCGEDECNECGKRFSWSRHTLIDYATDRLDDEQKGGAK